MTHPRLRVCKSDVVTTFEEEKNPEKVQRVATKMVLTLRD